MEALIKVYFDMQIFIYRFLVKNSMALELIASNFSLSGAVEVLKPLVSFVIGVVVYAIFVFKFYRLLARKDIFEINIKAGHKTSNVMWSLLLYVIKYILMFPLFVFFWFAILTALLSFLSKDQQIQSILLVSMALVAAVRVTAYYNEELSKDLAKMLPFALLGVFLINVSFFSFTDSIALMKQIPSNWVLLAYYLLFVIALEFVLRIGHGIVGMMKES